MGSLTYGAVGTNFVFDDRTLFHLQLVIVAKLRRGERFCLSWSLGPDSGGGRCAVWLDPSIPIAFQFVRAPAISVNRGWLEQMMQAANSVDGLHLSAEPSEASRAG